MNAHRPAALVPLFTLVSWIAGASAARHVVSASHSVVEMMGVTLGPPSRPSPRSPCRRSRSVGHRSPSATRCWVAGAAGLAIVPVGMVVVPRGRRLLPFYVSLWTLDAPA